MRAREFITERKKRSKKTRGLAGYFFPGYGFYGSDAGEGGGDGGGGGESRHIKEDADGQQVLDYIHGTHHEPLTTQLQQAVLSHPRWELRSVPLSSLHIPDQEYDDEEQEPEADPYNRVQAIDPGHAGEYSANFVDRRPIVVDAEGWIIDGNHRAWAASELLNRDSIQAWVPAKKLAEGVYRGDWVRHPDNPWQIGQIQSIDNGQALVTWKKTDKRKKAMSSTHAVDALQHARREFSQLTQPTHTPGTGATYKSESVNQGVAEGATVTRIDSKPVTDFASGLKAYKHTDDWSQSGLDTGST